MSNDMHIVTFEQAAEEACKQLAKTVIAKQKDYGPKNITQSVVKTELALAVRLTDKIARLVHLSETGVKPSNESIQDTAQDIMGYGLVLKMYLDGTFTLPMEDTIREAN